MNDACEDISRASRGPKPMKITIPDFSLVVMIGASGSGKSSFATRNFAKTEIISSDTYRGIVSDDEASQEATDDAFELVHDIAAKRLKRRKLAVIDATNVRAEDRAELIDLAVKYHAPPVALVINPDAEICRAQNASRTTRRVPDDVIDAQLQVLRGSLSQLDGEGFRVVHRLTTLDEIANGAITRVPVAADKRYIPGPFDIIGDVHGCFTELSELLTRLGYEVSIRGTGANRIVASKPPQGRMAVFVGDLVDRGDNTPDVLRLVMHMVAEGHALCVPGNHDNKLMRWLRGNDVKQTHGLDKTVEQLDCEPAELRPDIEKFIADLPSHLWLADGKLAVAHAGIKDKLLGRVSLRVYMFCLYGETSGETDEFGLPIRYNWAAEYSGETSVVYGHTPVPEAQWMNNTLCLDTGCCFGGRLTALRWPENETVSVTARQVYAEPIRPFGHPPARPKVAKS